MRFILIFLLATSLQAQEHRLLPDPILTPGRARTTTAEEICSKSFRTKKYRKTDKYVKKYVCMEYGVLDCPHQGKEELDHLIPLELGGEDSDLNLWVQMSPEFHWKDKLENLLKKLVCMQPTIELQNADLKQAQGEISTDWVKAYREYIGPLPSDPK